MIFIINDSEVIISETSVRGTQGGTASFVAGFIQFCRSHSIDYQLIGNYTDLSCSGKVLKRIKTASNAVFTLKLFWYLLWHRQRKEDLLYFHRPDHVASSCFTGCKKVLHIHGQPRATIHKGRGLIKRIIYYFLEKTAIKMTDRFIFTDARSANNYLNFYPLIGNNHTVIPTGIDLSFFKPTGSSKIRTDEVKIIIYFGRFEYPKRLDKIINSFIIAERIAPGLKLVLCGRGTEKKRLEKMVKESGWESKIFFTGELSKEDVLSLIQSASATVLLSYNEGSPVSLKESLACGVPVIVNNVGDVEDYVVSGLTGAIVDSDSNDDVAKAMILVTANAPSMTNACREIVLQYNEDSIHARVIKELN